MLRKETIEPATLGLLRDLFLLPELKDYRLVGGTALSLLYGHRKSINLDLFTDKPLEKDLLIPSLENAFGKIIATNERFKNVYQCIIKNVKVDFVSVRDPFLNPVNTIDGISFADIKDLIALKLNAVKGRGVKKDFWDLARLLKDYSLNDLFGFYHERYSNDDTFAVIRSVIYFNDAEITNEPESLDGMTWPNAKQIISKAFDDYYKDIRN